MKIGFTGTQHGMTENQKALLRAFLRPAWEFHHGDCIGADAEAHDIAKAVGCRIVVHPPSNPRKRALKHGDEARRPLHYLDRNNAIVAETDLLVAAPKSIEEEVRSGTWYTIRRARKHSKPVHILEPS